MEKLVTKATNIIDILGVVMEDHIGITSLLNSTLLPGTLDKTFIVEGPAFFPVVWSWVQHWIKGEMAENTYVLGEKQVNDVLLGLMKEEDLPSIFGGSLE